MDVAHSAAPALAGSANDIGLPAHSRWRRRVGLGRHARVDFRTGTSLLVAETLIAWTLWRDGEAVNEIARHIGRTRTFTHSLLFGGGASLVAVRPTQERGHRSDMRDLRRVPDVPVGTADRVIFPEPFWHIAAHVSHVITEAAHCGPTPEIPDRTWVAGGSAADQLGRITHAGVLGHD